MKYQDYVLGEINLRYLIDENTQHISMVLLPTGMESCFEDRREILQLRSNICPAWDVGTLCHLALRHHAQGNGAGNTLKYGESTNKLKFIKQEKLEDENKIDIVTWLKADEGYGIKHIVEYVKGELGIQIETIFMNHTGKTLTLDMISSFSLDNLSPFQVDDAPYKLKLHRIRGGWSLEGKHVENSVEDLNLESTWFRAFPESERFGGLGSHPVARWFPFGCVQDLEKNVYWATQLESSSSWQMEFSKDGDCYSLSGGIADCEFGGWWKDIKDGEDFRAPKAYVSVSNKSLWDVCQNITEMFHKYADQQPKSEENLPMVFNEWCTTWGNPTEENVLALAEKIKELPFSYLVIDAGWSKKEIVDNNPQGGNGGWECDLTKFPNGLQPLSRKLKDMGLHMGIWLEFEVTTEGAAVHSGVYDELHLYRNGELIQTGEARRFWDFRKPEVIKYLREKVIDFLRDNNIPYLKVDYNGSIGYGCDGAESLGEGLRAQMEAVYNFFRLIREELPEVIIENCASGAHRMEPAMVQMTAMSSFSDAHESREIPYIAANLHQLILPRQSQVWAVLSKELSIEETQYRLISALLGRFCLSGTILELNEDQWGEVKKAAGFYESIKEIIRDGRSNLYRNCTDNQHNLKGAQVLVRNNGEQALLICHSFENATGIKVSGDLPMGNWKVKSHVGAAYNMIVKDSKFEITLKNPWEAFALLLEKAI